jgi:hypothetical protein
VHARLERFLERYGSKSIYTSGCQSNNRHPHFIPIFLEGLGEIVKGDLGDDGKHDLPSRLDISSEKR